MTMLFKLSEQWCWARKNETMNERQMNEQTDRQNLQSCGARSDSPQLLQHSQLCHQGEFWYASVSAQ